MSKDYWYIEIVEERVPYKNIKRYSIISKSKCYLGSIKWYEAWRRYCFYPDGNNITILSRECMLDIVDFIDNLMEEHFSRKQE